MKTVLLNLLRRWRASHVNRPRYIGLYSNLL